MILYDIFGNPMRSLPAVGGDAIIDNRQSTVNLAALNAEVVVDIAQENTGAIDVRFGAFVGTLVVESSIDGINFLQLPVWNVSLETYQASIAVAGMFQVDIPAGFKKLKVRASAYTSGSAVVALRASNALDFLYTKQIPANIMATATSTVGAAISLNLPAVVGMYHYICSLQVVKFAAALLTAGVTPVVTAAANISGAPVLSFGAAASAQGTYEEQKFEPCNPLKSTTANTITTISCPATPNIIWRLNAIYYVGA